MVVSANGVAAGARILQHDLWVTCVQVQLQLLTAIVKLFLKRPGGTQELVQKVLGLSTQVRNGRLGRGWAEAGQRLGRGWARRGSNAVQRRITFCHRCHV